MREKLSSSDGDSLGNAILAEVASGNAVTVTLSQGGTLTLTDVAEAGRVLQTRFGWEPAVPRSKSAAVANLRMRSDLAAAHLFEMCKRMGRPFTMEGIVSRVLHEQPHMAHQFAELWGTLISHKLVRVHQPGEINTYEVTKWHRS